jgi:hypothetical protein
MVYGREQDLVPLLNACVKVKSKKFGKTGVTFTLENKSSIPIVLTKAPGSEGLWYPRYIVIPPFSTQSVKARPLLVDNKQPKFDQSLSEIVVNFKVDNFLGAPNKPIDFSVSVPCEW